MRVRIHNEYFRTVSLGKRKSCPSCGTKLAVGESIWSWGEYWKAQWGTIQHFCKTCYPSQVKGPLKGHAKPCGCEIKLIGYQGERLPAWLTLD